MGVPLNSDISVRFLPPHPACLFSKIWYIPGRKLFGKTSHQSLGKYLSEEDHRLYISMFILLGCERTWA